MALAPRKHTTYRKQSTLPYPHPFPRRAPTAAVNPLAINGTEVIHIDSSPPTLTTLSIIPTPPRTDRNNTSTDRSEEPQRLFSSSHQHMRPQRTPTPRRGRNQPSSTAVTTTTIVEHHAPTGTTTTATIRRAEPLPRPAAALEQRNGHHNQQPASRTTITTTTTCSRPDPTAPAKTAPTGTAPPPQVRAKTKRVPVRPPSPSPPGRSGPSPTKRTRPQANATTASRLDRRGHKHCRTQ